MNDKRWTIVDRLLGEVLERAPHERAGFLREACGDDEALRCDVESLVAHAASGIDVLSTPAVALADGIGSAGTSMLGRHIGPYVIAARLGAGGMGEVHRARDTKLGRDVAIKILPRIVATAPDRRARLDREARLLAALNHPHIGAIYGLEELDGTPALILELVEGDTLAERVAKGPIPLTEALTIARQIADALDAAHEKGIVHRDLKPANIKITADGIVKVLDFGLAKAAAGETSGPDLTQSPTVTIGGTHDGVILGTAPYMSPEQARGKAVDKRTDVWAFGCVFYEMLTGRVAFVGDTLSDTIAAILDHEPEWAALPAATPAPIRRLLLRCLDKDAKRRLRDIGDVRTELDDVLSGGTSTLAPVTVATTPASVLDAQMATALVRRHRGAILVAVLGMALAGAGAVYFTTREAPPPSSSGTTFSLQTADIIPLTTTGDTTLPAISSDGKWFTYVQRDANGDSLWIRQTSTRNPPLLLVPSQPRVPIRGATITPDGAFVDFLRPTGGTTMLWRVASTPHTTPMRLVENVRTPVAWSPNKPWKMAFVRNPNELVVADADGQNPNVLATLPTGEVFNTVITPNGANKRLAWSPRGDVIAITGVAISPMMRYAMFVTVANGHVHRVPQTPAGTGAWLNDSSLVWARPDMDGAPSQLWRLSYPAGVLSPLTNDLSSYEGVSLSDDRDSFVTAKTDHRVGIWVGNGKGNAASGKEAVTDAALPLVRNGSSVAWAQDRLLYHARSGDSVALSSFFRDSTEPKIPDAYGPATTSDGLTTVYASTAAGEVSSLWSKGADVRGRTRLTDFGVGPVITHDNLNVIFAAPAPEGDNRLWMVSIEGGAQKQIVTRAAVSPDVSHDGKLAFASRGDQNQPVVVVCDPSACSTQQEFPLVNPRGGGVPIRWIPAKIGRGIAYVGAGPQPNIWVQPLDGSKPRPFTFFVDEREIIDFAWSRDGEHLAIARARTTSDIVLFKNLWRP